MPRKKDTLALPKPVRPLIQRTPREVALVYQDVKRMQLNGLSEEEVALKRQLLPSDVALLFRELKQAEMKTLAMMRQDPVAFIEAEMVKEMLRSNARYVLYEEARQMNLDPLNALGGMNRESKLRLEILYKLQSLVVPDARSEQEDEAARARILEEVNSEEETNVTPEGHKHTVKRESLRRAMYPDKVEE